MAEIDRAQINRALAKAIAFKQCGKQVEAEDWARRLIELLECEGILADGAAVHVGHPPTWPGYVDDRV